MKTNLIIYSGHINEIANSIQNSKDILVDGLTRFYGQILNFSDLAAERPQNAPK